MDENVQYTANMAGYPMGKPNNMGYPEQPKVEEFKGYVGSVGTGFKGSIDYAEGYVPSHDIEALKAQAAAQEALKQQ